MPQQDWFSQFETRPALTPMRPMASHASTPAADEPDWFAQFEPPAAAEPPSHPLATFARRLGEAGQGAIAGAASTIYHGGDLIRRGLGMERVIERPEVQAAIMPPDTGAGKAGFLLEQGAEFAVPLTRVAKAVAKAPILTRLGVDAVTSAGVAGLQSGGDTDNMAIAGGLGMVLPPALRGAVAVGRAGVGAAQRAAAGAAEGGLGGAVAAALRTGAPLPAKSMIVQALKPRSTQVTIDQTLNRALPELKATEAALGRPIATVDDLLEATTLAKQRVRGQYDEMMGPQKAMGSTVDLSPVATAMETSVPSKVKLEDPRVAASILDKADSYRRRFSIDEAEQLLKETNAELHAYYGKYPAAQRAATTANPDIAHLVAQAKALRTAIYATLDAPGQGKAAAEVQKRYGSLMEIEDTAFRRRNVANRQQPESLAEQIAQAGAMGDMARGTYQLLRGNPMGMANILSARAQRAGAKFLKEQQTTDKLIERAFAAFKGAPAPITMPGQPRIAGLLNRGPLVTPPPPDGSYVRAVPGQYGARVPPEPGVPARQLPAGTPPQQSQLPPGRDRVFVSGEPPLPVVEGEILPQRALPSGPPSQRQLPPGRDRVLTGAAVPSPRAARPSVSVRAPVADLDDAGRKIYSSDPAARSVRAVQLSKEEAVEVRSMLAEMENLPFQKHVFNEIPRGNGGTMEIVPGSAGARVYSDITGEHGVDAGRRAVIDGLQKTLAGNPSTYGPAIRVIARMRRNGQLAREFPPDAGVREGVQSGTMSDRDFEAFSAFLDDLSALGGDEGKIQGKLLAFMGGGAASAAAFPWLVRPSRQSRPRR